MSVGRERVRVASDRSEGRRLVVVAADGSRLPDRRPPGTDASMAISVAVLPFDGAGDAGDEDFAEGLAEDVMMELSRFHNLVVAARGASFACRGMAGDPARIARHLRVDYLLEGGVRRSPDRARVSVRLLEGASGRLIASQRLEHPAADLLSAQEDLARRIAAEMAAALDAAALQRAERLPLEDLHPLGLVFRARATVLRGSEIEDAAAIDAGIELARRATALGPHCAEAWRVLAWAHCVRGERGLFGAAARADYRAADDAATRLRALEPGSDAAHAVLGHIAMRQGRHGEALESLRHAHELNPNSAPTLRWLAWEESNHGLAGPALEHATLSLRLSPRDHQAYLGYWTAALAHWVAGDLVQCEEHARRAVALTPRFGGYYILLAACLAEHGKQADAADAVARVRQNCPGLLESRLAGNSYFVDPALAARYRAALARATGVAAAPEPTPLPPALAALTGREREVLRLVAQGRSNAALAEALGISEHTAKRHIANILLKLDLPTRSAAATLAGRYGLT